MAFSSKIFHKYCITEASKMKHNNRAYDCTNNCDNIKALFKLRDDTKLATVTVLGLLYKEDASV